MNAIAAVCYENFGISKGLVGVVIAALTAIVIFGGIKSIARVCEKLVPFMAIFYVAGCIVILCMNYDYILPSLKTICALAFKPGAAAGGLIESGLMMAIRYGVARGLFSNESGLGWAYYGERCVEYFSGKRGLIPYRILYILVAAVAPVVALDLVWLIADTLNALMAIPNLVAVLLLSGEVVRETKKYINNLDAKDESPVPIVEE